jgi:protoheme IX farnesyltransferase
MNVFGVGDRRYQTGAAEIGYLKEEVTVFPRVRIILELTKYRISVFASLSALAGYLLGRQKISSGIIIPLLGTFLLACGSCALNQFQERTIDGLMERTKGRPLPSGTLAPCSALRISLGLIFLGAVILFCGAGPTAGGLGVFAIVWYNGFYTYLKRRSAFAAIPGALVGAIPPALGWVSGGGALFDRQILAVALFFFLWQVPHFWLLLLDCSKDYATAGLPSLTTRFSREQLKRIVWLWTLATAASSLLIPLFYFVNFFFVHVSLLLATLWLVWNATTVLRNHSRKFTFKPSFWRLNVFALFVMAMLSIDNVLKSSHANLSLVMRVLAMIGFKPV